MLTVTGFDEVKSNIEKTIQSLSPEEVEATLLEGAQIIADAAKTKVHDGPTGNLKSSLEAKIIHREPGSVAAIAGVNFKKAPHAYLVEYGHLSTMRTGESSTYTRHGVKYTKYKTKPTNRKFVPGHPYFRPAWDETAEPVTQGIVDDLKNKAES